MKRFALSLLLLPVLLLVVSLAGCRSPSKPGEKPYSVSVNPADYVKGVDNPYLPLKPGTKLVYEGKTSEGTERIEDIVTRETKKILGVICIVVENKVKVDGVLVEQTLDWYAQDRKGNVWYFGEDSREYENGKVVSTKGSWEAGIDGAMPGVIMKAKPKAGEAYRQEYYRGEAEDMAQVLSLSETVTVPYGSFKNVLKTKEWTPLDPGFVEHKYYAPSVGLVLEVMVQGGSGRVELIEITSY